LHNLGRYEEAIASCDRAISINPDNHEVWNNRGVPLRKLERYEEAIASYDRAISINSDKHQAWHNKGLTYFKWGKYVESIDCYNQAISIEADLYDSWHYKGTVQFVMGNYKDALNSWQQTFQIIQQLTPRPNDIAGLIQEFLAELIPRFSLPNSQPQISTFLTQLATIYQQAQVLPELSTALIATLPQILAPNISDYTADEWLALWQNLLGTTPTLEMPLRLMNVAIAYKKQPAQQKRLWLGLAKEEREILNGALELAAIPNSDSL
jgi:tetratricopeptide (TPR) repeat protein